MKHNIKSIILTFFLSIVFLTSNCSAAPAADSSAATLIAHRDSGLTIYEPTEKGGTVSSQGGFLFYSNNPEYVYSFALADKGCWLNRAEVSGSGQVYVWHNNAVGKTIQSVLCVSNPNKSTIVIKSNQCGLTNGYLSADTAAWNSYLTSGQPGISIEVEPGQSVELFRQLVATGNNYGIIADLSITDAKGEPAKALLKDLAYDEKSNWVFKYAAPDGSSRNRGVGESFQNIITFNPVKISDKNYCAYSIGASNDSLKGQDLLKIKDSGSNNDGLLAGSYGQLITINLPIRNNYRRDQNFGIFIGSIGGNCYPFVKLKEKTSFVSLPVKPFVAYDMIQTGEIGFHATKTVSFSLVIPALSSTPLIIGVHPIN